MADAVVELGSPSPDAGAIAAINLYVDDEQFDGGWLSDVPLVSAERLVKGARPAHPGRSPTAA
ncbi:MAG: hypothetical protein ACTHJW_00260, partial [Streptosporangiaceae bacterium]